MPKIDPELAPLVAVLPPDDWSDPIGRRERLFKFHDGRQATPAPWADSVEYTDHVIVGLRPDHTVRIRVARPRGKAGPLPVLLWFHGGGFVTGHLEGDFRISGRYAAEVGIAVVHVDYRLAPEFPYPAAVDDATAALRWIRGEGAEHGLDPDRIVLGGASAGGSLAAAAALTADRDAGWAPVLLLMIYPTLDVRRAVAGADDGPIAVDGNGPAVGAWRHYLGERAGDQDIPATAAPARASDAELAEFPPTYIAIAQADRLHDEGADFALRLARAGVDVALHSFAGAPHAFLAFDSALTRRAQAEIDRVVRAAIER